MLYVGLVSFIYVCIPVVVFSFSYVVLNCVTYIYTYVLQGNIGNVHNLQWCKFVADRMHEKLSNQKFRQICLLALMVHICVFFQFFYFGTCFL